ncbi:MAG: secondary thiamine-phosphate synthase enzyme YjbQ [Myxococcota bacterium]|nr:secondary thiamine-phosphate synthase enzyme YjbQ [Myxococcota bacterium]
MRQAHHTVEVRTPGRGLVAFTAQVERWLASVRPATGLLTLFIQHTSAGLLIQENADPDVRTDLDRWLSRLVEDGDPLFTHTAEGPDDMPAHVRAALTQTQLGIPVIDGRLALGTWQGLYVFEHRHRGHTRRVVLHYLGD